MTYEYICTACGNEWEAEQSIKEAPLKKCPKCNASTAKRQVSGGTGFLLKGGGWYADGYGSTKSAVKETSSDSLSKESKSSTESSSDSGTKKEKKAASSSAKE